MPMVEGTCLCGDVAWSAESLELVLFCHCSICRKLSGASFASTGATPERDFRWLRAENVRRYESSPGLFRQFCRRCGSKVPNRPPNRPMEGHVFLPLGNVQGDLGVTPLGHIFTASKAPWYTITGSVPQFEELPPGVAQFAVPARSRR